MNAQPVLWSAEDPESSAARVGGRPVHLWWSRLRGAFSAVLLEPRRRAGGGTVGWRWRTPAYAPTPSAADLAVLRRRLNGALLDFSDELERAEGGSGELHKAMHAVFGALVNAPDARLSVYVVPTEVGWMIRSWGFAQPSPASSEIAADAESDKAVVTESPAAAPGRPPAARRKRLKWAVLAAGATAAFLIAAWSLGEGRAVTANTAVESVEKPRTSQVSETGSAKTIGPTVAPPLRLEKAGGLPTVSVANLPASYGRSNVSVKRGANSEELVAAPVPAAFTGVMPVSADEIGDRAGPASRLQGETASGISPARPEGAAVESALSPVNAAKGAAAEVHPGNTAETEETSDAKSPSRNGTEAVNGRPSPAHAAPAVIVPKDGSEFDVEAHGNLSREAPPSAPGKNNVLRGESLRAAAEADDAKGVFSTATTIPRMSKQPEPASACVGGIVSNIESGGPTKPGMSAQLSTDAWRAVRVRDVMLATWPSERAAGWDALKTARAQALEVARAELPLSFRAPVAHQGWRLHLAASSLLPVPPVWRDAASGRMLDCQKTDHESGWTSVELTGGVDARLVAADGREYARATAGKDRRSANVQGGPEVLAIVPWAAVDISSGETTASRWKWRSLAAGWSDAGWETFRDERRVGVCFPSAPAGKSGGVLALVDEASGWALACEWSLGR